MTLDTPYKIHRHRVETVLNLIAPYSWRERHFPVAEVVNDLRQVYGIALARAAERDRDNEVHPFDYGLEDAVRDASFHDMTRDETGDVISDVADHLEAEYGDIIQYASVITMDDHPFRARPRWFWCVF